MVKDVNYDVQELSGGDVTATGFEPSPSSTFWSRLHERIVIEGGEGRRSNPVKVTLTVCKLWPATETMLDYAVYVDDEVLTGAGRDVEEGVAVDAESLAEKTASESENTK
ncbi:hypothetical protein V1515DRAFT_579011 [Lipomyces mesembrius]